MNRMRWMFGDTKNQKNMNTKQKQKKLSKPKLDRRNAIKNIDYEANRTNSSSEDQSSSSLRTRSLDLSPYSDRTSFRIGGHDGDIDRMFWSLGLSGPEDLAIPAAAWEARKVRSSSDILPLSRLNPPESPENLVKREEVEEDRLLTRADAAVKIGDDRVVVDDSGGLDELRNSSVAMSTVRVANRGGGGGGGGGIRGVRPPALAPPPSMKLPDLGNVGTTWDILKAFAPEDNNNQGCSSKVRGEDTSSSDEEEDDVIDGDEVEEIAGGVGDRRDADELRLGETAVLLEAGLSESCSFSTSNDDDTSSTNTDPTYIISPNARFRCGRIGSWSKGSLLGSGSFGTVFEGLSE